MDLYARINILDGRAVRLPKGDVRQAISLDADPVARAVGWVEKGADRLFVVDLDAAAYRDTKNRPIIRAIVEAVDVPVLAAGGVRSGADVDCMLGDLGVAQVGMGTAAINNEVQLWELCREHPGRIFVTLDVLPDEELATRGWTAGSGRYLEEVLIAMSSAGAAGFHVQSANRDALAEPSNLGILGAALQVVSEPVIASGGARDLKDLIALRDLEREGRRLQGIVVGREITEGRFTIEEARVLVSGD
jgi:phosphoribosylformimino-5-aminoimidazole carboxamide ribotide isomerase